MLTVWKPFGGMTPFRTWVDDMFENLAPLPAWPDAEVKLERPRFDLNDEPERFVLAAEIPGVKPEEITVALEGDLLTVEYAHEEKKEEEGRIYHRFGAFKRAFRIPKNVAGEGITAEMVHGLLTLVLPKVAAAEPKNIPIGTAAPAPPAMAEEAPAPPAKVAKAEKAA